jgi:hypothetical protein
MYARPLLIENTQPKLDESVKEIVANFFVETFHIGANKPLPIALKFEK